MAVTWNWADKCGKATIYSEIQKKEFTLNLYQGNAYLIFINEYKENGEDMYNVYSFFVDEKHAKRMLGLEKGSTNAFKDCGVVLKSIEFNKDKCRNLSDIVGLFIRAFDNLNIGIYSGDFRVDI